MFISFMSQHAKMHMNAAHFKIKLIIPDSQKDINLIPAFQIVNKGIIMISLLLLNGRARNNTCSFKLLIDYILISMIS